MNENTIFILVLVILTAYVLVMGRYDRKIRQIKRSEINKKYEILFNLLDLDTVDNRVVLELFKMREEELQNAKG